MEGWSASGDESFINHLSASLKDRRGSEGG